MNYRKNNHSVFALNAHLVFVTKYRHRIFTSAHLTRLEAVLADTGAPLGVIISEFNGEANHVHLLIDYPPAIAVSDIARRLKGAASRTMRSEFPELRRTYWREGVLWSPAYFAASAGGAPLEVLRRYIEQQARPD